MYYVLCLVQSLNDCISVLPGQRAVDNAIDSIHAASAALERQEFPASDKPYGQLQAELNSAAAGLSDASTEVVSSVRSPQHLEKASNKFGNAVGDILEVGMEMAGQTKVTLVDRVKQSTILAYTFRIL